VVRLPPLSFVRQCLIAAIQAPAHGEAHGATDIQAGDRMVGHRIGAVTVVVVAVHVVNETPHVFPEGIINHHKRLAAALAMRCRLLEHEPDSTAIDFVLPPGGLGENAGEIRFVGPIQNTAGDMSQALVGQHAEPYEKMLEVPKLALVLAQIAKDRCVFRDDGSWGDKWPWHRTSPGLDQHFRSDPRGACGPWHGKSPQSSYSDKSLNEAGSRPYLRSSL
jgi:hypothetical protein